MELSKVCNVDYEDTENGKWFTYCEDENGKPVRFLIARENNKKYKRVSRKLFRKYAIQIRNKSLTDEKAEPLVRKLYAQTILLGWDNLEEDGITLEYSSDVAERVLGQEPILFEWVKNIAMETDAFAKEDENDVTKN